MAARSCVVLAAVSVCCGWCRAGLGDVGRGVGFDAAVVVVLEVVLPGVDCSSGNGWYGELGDW